MRPVWTIWLKPRIGALSPRQLHLEIMAGFASTSARQTDRGNLKTAAGRTEGRSWMDSDPDEHHREYHLETCQVLETGRQGTGNTLREMHFP